MKKIIFILIFIPSLIVGQWVKTSGPPGGSVSAIIPAGQNLLAGTLFGGVYWSSNFGISWNQCISLNHTNVAAFLNTGPKVFTAATQGVYVSSDNGQNWTQTSLNNSMSCLASNGSYIFAGGLSGRGLYRSSDSGLSWSLTAFNNSSVYSIFIKGIKIFACVTGNFPQNTALFLSTNNGLNWTQTSLTFRQVVCMAAKDSTIIAGASPGLLVSTDDGNTWTLKLSLGIYSLCINGQIFYAGTSNGLYRSTDNGQNWVQVSLAGKYINAIYSTGSNFYAGTSTDGALFSVDSGYNWVQLPLLCRSIYCLKQNNSVIYAASYGLFTTQSEGQSWTPTSLNNTAVYSLDFDLPYIYAAGNKMLVSSDGGDNWTVTANNNYYAVKVFGSRVLAGAGNGIFISTDHGLNWIQTFVNPINCILTKDQIVYAGTANGFSKSLDSGMTFTQIFSGEGVNCAVIEDSIFYIGTSGSGVCFSTNNGDTWIHSPLNNLNVLSVAASGSLVLAGTSYNGVFKSTDRGLSWTEINEGMGQVPVSSLLITGTYVYAGIRGSSVWKRPVSQLTGSTKISNTYPVKFLLIQNYPNPFNPTTKIKYQIPKFSDVKLMIYDILGREVTVLVNLKQQAGTYEVSWDASGYPSGIYIYKLMVSGADPLHMGAFTGTGKMVFLK